MSEMPVQENTATDNANDAALDASAEEVPVSNFVAAMLDVLDHREGAKIANKLSSAIETYAKTWAANQTTQISERFKFYVVGLCFSLAVILLVGIFARWGILSNDATASLIGIVIGYLFGRQQGRG